jgi:hypothetical protein
VKLRRFFDTEQNKIIIFAFHWRWKRGLNMETKTITTSVLPGQYFLSSLHNYDVGFAARFDENRLYFLFSEKLEGGKWKVNLSFERIGRQYSTSSDSSYGLGYSSSDIISFIVEPDNKIRLAHHFTTSVSETMQDVTLFGNVKEKQYEIIYNLDYLVFKEICQDSIVIETHWMREE